MRRSLLLAFVSTFAVASVALAATGGKEPKEPKATLVQAGSQTNHAASVHYGMQVPVAPVDHPSLKLLAELSSMTGGTEVRHVAFSAKIGGDGYVHGIRVTGATADGTKSVIVTARLFGFGRPVRVTPPREGTFIDQKLLSLAA